MSQWVELRLGWDAEMKPDVHIGGFILVYVKHRLVLLGVVLVTPQGTSSSHHHTGAAMSAPVTTTQGRQCQLQ